VSPRTLLPKSTDRLPLGDSGLRVSPCCVGIVRDPKTISAAFDAGINFFFVTADMHWPLYENIRRGLADLLARGRHMRERIVVAGVAYVTQAEFCAMPYEELLEAVPGLGHLDVLIAGGVYAAEFPTRLAVYTEHRRQRFVGARAIGASFHERRAAIPAIRDNVIDHYRFVMSRPEIDGMLIAPSKPEHVVALADALEEGPLSDEEQAHMINLAAVDRGDARPIEKD
jgi:hypothetical protein